MDTIEEFLGQGMDVEKAVAEVFDRIPEAPGVKQEIKQLAHLMDDVRRFRADPDPSYWSEMVKSAWEAAWSELVRADWKKTPETELETDDELEETIRNLMADTARWGWSDKDTAYHLRGAVEQWAADHWSNRRGGCGCHHSKLEMPEFGVFICPEHGRTEV